MSGWNRTSHNRTLYVNWTERPITGQFDNRTIFENAEIWTSGFWTSAVLCNESKIHNYNHYHWGNSPDQWLLSLIVFRSCLSCLRRWNSKWRSTWKSCQCRTRKCCCGRRPRRECSGLIHTFYTLNKHSVSFVKCSGVSSRIFLPHLSKALSQSDHFCYGVSFGD